MVAENEESSNGGNKQFPELAASPLLLLCHRNILLLYTTEGNVADVDSAAGSRKLASSFASAPSFFSYHAPLLPDQISVKYQRILLPNTFLSSVLTLLWCNNQVGLLCCLNTLCLLIATFMAELRCLKKRSETVSSALRLFSISENVFDCITRCTLTPRVCFFIGMRRPSIAVGLRGLCLMCHLSSMTKPSFIYAAA